MKLINNKRIFCLFVCLGILIMNSCAPTPSYEERTKIIVSPHKLSVCSGSEDTVFVRLLDKESGPLFGMKINATRRATFAVKGISPGYTNIIFSVAGQKASMEVIFVEH